MDQSFLWRSLRGLVGVAFDVTERNQAAEVLRRSERKLRDAAHIANLGYWETDFDTKVVTWSEESFGLEAHERQASLETLIALIHPEDRGRVLSAVDATLSGDARHNLEYRVVQPGGAVRWVHSVGDVEIDQSGRPKRMFGTVQDITERKQAEELLRESQERRHRAEGLASLGTLTASVAHEINNPNNFIMLNVPVLEQVLRVAEPLLEERFRTEGDFPVGKMPYSKARERIPKIVHGIREGSQRIKSYVAELRAFATPAASQPEAVDLRKVTDASVSLTESLIQKSTDRFLVDMPAALPSVSGHPQRLSQVVVNLVQNACHALSNRSQAITLGLRHDAAANTVELTVRDEGHGMDGETQAKIFDPFFTTRRETGGTGLGLSVSKEIADEHGGRLEIESEPGKGTTARLILPARQGEAPDHEG